MDRRSPTYWQEHYVSNHFMAGCALDKENETRLEVRFSIPDFAFEAGAWQGVVNDKIYYGADARVAQKSGSVSLTSVYVRKDFRVRGFHFDHRVLLQWSTDQAAAPVPLLSAYLSYYYEFWVKRDVLRLQAGFDGRYNTEYYAPGYNPALAQFYNQREVKVGNYPYVDAYVTAKWKTHAHLPQVPAPEQGALRQRTLLLGGALSADAGHVQNGYLVGILRLIRAPCAATSEPGAAGD